MDGTSRPRRKGLAGLLALNGLLLGLLAAISFSPGASAQAAPRGKYTMVAGGAKGSASDVVYIADVVHRELIALGYEPNQRQLIGVGYRNLAADSQSAMRPGASR